MKGRAIGLGSWNQGRLSSLRRLIRTIFAFDCSVAISLLVLNGSRGLVSAAQVVLLCRFIDAATAVVRSEIQFSEAILWAVALVGLNLVGYGIGLISDTRAHHFQEGLRGHIEEQCYRKAQTLPLAQLETAAFHDQLQRARRGIERRLFSTLTFMWRSVSDVVLPGEFPLGAATYPDHWNESRRIPSRTRQQGALSYRPRPHARRAKI